MMVMSWYKKSITQHKAAGGYHMRASHLIPTQNQHRTELLRRNANKLNKCCSTCGDYHNGSKQSKYHYIKRFLLAGLWMRFLADWLKFKELWPVDERRDHQK